MANLRKKLTYIAVLLLLNGAVSVILGQKKLINDFRANVEERLKAEDMTLSEACPVDTNVVARRVFKDYGAMFVASSKVRFPPRCVFENEEEVTRFQSSLDSDTLTLGGKTVELQASAVAALKEAVAEANKKDLSITPRGSSASKRSYEDTYRIWRSRFDPALKYWTGKGKIPKEAAEASVKMDTTDQVIKVIEWEKDSIWFSTGFDRSIFSSVAAPGTSQHLSMLALDVSEFANKNVRAILNKHGWYQTIIDDTPHFTFLGLDESDLPSRGLVGEERGGFKFWIPNFER